MADMYKAEQRGMSLAIANFAPYLGAAVGPIIGGYISKGVGWPWIFWTVSTFDGILLLLAIFIIHESYSPVLLAAKAKKLRKATGMNYQTKFEQAHARLSSKLTASLARPLRLLATRPIIHVLSLILAYNFGVYCLALSSFAALWTDKYHDSISTSGLHYIAISLGSTVSAQIGGPLTDRVYAHLKSKAKGTVSPEYRVPMMVPGALLMPIGLFWYGWSAEKGVFWLVTDFGAAIFRYDYLQLRLSPNQRSVKLIPWSFGVMLSSQAFLAYIIDEFGKHSASANAGVRILSNIMGFAFPIFAPKLYRELGYGWGNSLLAFLYLAMGVPAPLLLWKWGPKLRALGRPVLS